MNFDVRIYHPRSQYRNGRPKWYFENGREPYLCSKDITIGHLCLLFAYPIDEDPAIAVAIDIVELNGREDKTALAPHSRNLYHCNQERKRKGALQGNVLNLCCRGKVGVANK